MSKAFTIKVEGEKELQLQLQRLLGVSLNKAKKTITNSAEAIRTEASSTAPVKTGLLRNSITRIISPDGMSVTVGTNVEYAPFVEYGTRKMEQAHGKHGEGWGDNFKPANPPITDWAAKRARGATGQQMPFLTPAFLKERENFMKQLRKEIESEVRKRNR